MRRRPVSSWAAPIDNAETNDDDVTVAELTVLLVQLAADEWQSIGSLDDPYVRCSELLAVELSRSDPHIQDRVEAEACHLMVDAAHELADRLREDDESGDW